MGFVPQNVTKSSHVLISSSVFKQIPEKTT